ncbi:sigma-70 family RNA polymerase sigma factor [Roseibium sp. M-1]
MSEIKFLSQEFEKHRAQMKAIAYRMLGSTGEAEDAVQEAWFRLERGAENGILNLGGWLTTVVARICLDMLRARKARREELLDGEASQTSTNLESGISPEDELAMADTVGIALLVVLERLAPAERLAFVLHDLFSFPFDDIAAIVDRSPEATRQLASRARRRVRGGAGPGETGHSASHEVVKAFLAAARSGDFHALVSILDPDVVFRADSVAALLGSSSEIKGAHAVADAFKGRAQAARAALVDGKLGLLVAPGGKLRIVLRLSFNKSRIATIEAIANPVAVAALEISPVD